MPDLHAAASACTSVACNFLGAGVLPPEHGSLRPRGTPGVLHRLAELHSPARISS